MEWEFATPEDYYAWFNYLKGYASKLITIITSNALYQYDQEAIAKMQAITTMQGQVQTLLNTAEAHVVRIDALERQIKALQAQASQPVPDWAK